MKEESQSKNEQIFVVVEQLRAIGEEITFEQAEKMLESMHQLVTLAINQYFRELSESKIISSTKL